jgi:hypothetical protein
MTCTPELALGCPCVAAHYITDERCTRKGSFSQVRFSNIENILRGLPESGPERVNVILDVWPPLGK